MSTRIERPPVAIVGIDVMFPGSPGTRGFWRDIVGGRDAIRDVPPTHWRIDDYYDPDPTARDRTYCHKGGFLSPVSFDPLEFGIPPAALMSIDTAQLLALIVARNVLAEVDQASAGPADRGRVSVILGVAAATQMVEQMCGRMQRPAWVGALRDAGLPEDRVTHIADRIADRFPEWQENTFPGLLGNVVAGRIANRFDLRGSNFVTDAACASSLASVQAGLDELYLGRSGLVLVGGVDALNDILVYMCFAKTMAFSRSGDIRPFAADADGTIIGEGVGIFALKLLEDAERDGDRVYAVIRGMGQSSDGRATSVYAPRAEGQAAALSRAYEAVGYAPDTVELIEGHGTATPAGDAAEIAGLKRVYGATASRPFGAHVAIGSVKSQIGHTKAAAGSAGLFKAVMALHHKVLPPTIKVERPNPRLGLDGSPFYINAEARPWIRGAGHPRRAAVSSFGFGGSNFHLTLEEYTGRGDRPARVWSGESVLLLLSAPSRVVMRERLAETRAALGGVADLAGFAAQTCAAFDPCAAVRVGIVAQRHDDFAAKLAALEAGGEAAGAWLGDEAPFSGKVAFLFPGQGSQYVGMGRALALHFDEARAVWDAAADVETFAGLPLHEIAFPPRRFDAVARDLDDARLVRVENAQPAIAAVSLSMLAILGRLGLAPDMVAGHSFGEYTALHAAGAFDAAELLTIARRSGIAMAAAAEGSEGAMLAVRLAKAEMGRRLDQWAIPDLVIANDNAPDRVILSGTRAAIDLAARRLKEQNVPTLELPIAGAYHSPIVAAAAEPFFRELERANIRAASLPVFSNRSAARHDPAPAAIRRALADLIPAPVRFREMISALHDEGARLFIEVGPSAVLTGLVAQCLGDRDHAALALDRKGKDGADSLLLAMARCAALGVRMRYENLQPSVPAAQVIPKPPPKHAVSLLGANLCKTSLAIPSAPTPATVPETKTTMSSPHPPPFHDPGVRGPVESLYQQLAETHVAFQKAMADSHQAFLGVAAQALASVSGNGGAPRHESPLLPPPPTAAAPAPLVPVAPPAPAMMRPVPVSAPAPLPPAPPIQPTLPVLAAAPAVTTPPTTHKPPQADLEQQVLEIVAEKTGYPIDMLKLEMDLEADLGVDSIKQVEILSGIQERRPDLPPLDPSRLSELRTLGAVISAIRGADVSTDTELVATNPNVPTPHEGNGKAEWAGNAMDVVSAGSVARHEWRLCDAPDDGSTLPGLVAGASIAVGALSESSPLADSLAAALTAAGFAAHRVFSTGDVADGLIIVDEGPVADAAVAAAKVARAIGWARAFAHHSHPRFFVVVETASDDGWTSGLGALARTAQREWPHIAVKAIRVAGDADRAAGRVMTELVDGSRAGTVTLTDRGRVVRRAVPAPLPAGAAESRLRDGLVVVASGGARGITAAAIKHLARHYRLRVALLGRTVLGEETPATRAVTSESELKRALIESARSLGDAIAPAEIARQAARILAWREIRRTLRDLEAAGAEAVYRSVDIAAADAVARCVGSVRATWGPITAVIHGAGVLRDKTLAEKTDAQVADVVAPKVLGLDALLRACADDPLEILCLFSSAASAFGNAGQADYAMANEILNQTARREARRRPGCVVKSVAWGPWDGGMVGPSLRTMFAQRNISLIPAAAGADFLLAELGRGSSAVEIVAGAPAN